MAQQIASGDTVSVHYTGKLENGEVFDTSVGGAPFKFTVGKSRIIKGFDNAVVGMKEGEKKTVTVPPNESYGEWRNDLVIHMPRSHIPSDMYLEKGTYIQVAHKSGRVIPALIVEIHEDVVKLDLNNPFVGKTLIFEIEIVETDLEPDLLPCADGCRRQNHNN
jgi:peptidylprolyl isomerase